MAIHRRDRHFQTIIEEIEVDTIPLKFIKDITCHLEDGSSVFIDQDAIRAHEEEYETAEAFIADLAFSDNLTDLNIRIDFGRVEANVDEQIASLLRGLSDDQSDSSN